MLCFRLLPNGQQKLGDAKEEGRPHRTNHTVEHPGFGAPLFPSSLSHHLSLSNSIKPSYPRTSISRPSSNQQHGRSRDAVCHCTRLGKIPGPRSAGKALMRVVLATSNGPLLNTVIELPSSSGHRRFPDTQRSFSFTRVQEALSSQRCQKEKSRMLLH